MNKLATVMGAASRYLPRESIGRLVGRLGEKLLDVASDDPSAGRFGDRRGVPGEIRTRR